MEISLDAANAIFIRFYDKVGELIADLMGRWFDEYMYEDVNEYKKCLQKNCGDNFSIDGFKANRTSWTILLNKSIYIFCEMRGNNVSISFSRKCYYDKLKGKAIIF